jgi:type I restriction enzyme, R subunit
MPEYVHIEESWYMNETHFAFLDAEWPDLVAEARKAEQLANPDPRTSCFYARRALELAVDWLYRSDRTLEAPYDTSLSALIHAPEFRTLVGQPLLTKAKLIKELGNRAVHSQKRIVAQDSITAVRELFHFTYWLARTYARKHRPPPGLIFRPETLPKTSHIPPQTLAKLQDLEQRLTAKDNQLAEESAKYIALDAELERLRAEIAKAKRENERVPDTHNYDEAQTRDAFIDLLLREAGWPLDNKDDREFPVTGMPNTKGEGFVDYVLWGDDGKPLGLVEAKRTKRDPREGQRQAELYANCLEKQFGQRPIIFYSNGYDHWMWDDRCYPPRPVQGFLKKDELQLAIQRRTSRQPLKEAEINTQIVERYYQARAIRRICEAFEKDNDRKSLLVMATGAGKTRTVIALADLLMRCNWVKRVLFLADRIALVNQTVKAFKVHLPTAAPVNLITDKATEGRVYVSTYPTMMGLIDETTDGQRRFGIGHFDLVVIDEAHRSIYQKYRAIFEYFDSFLVGLTATPKDEIDRNTYNMFELETGVPTDAYGLEDAVRDRFLVPPKSVSVPLKFQRHGIKYDDLSEDEKDQWDAIEWDDQGNVPAEVAAEAINRWLFNTDTVDKVLEHLMLRGQKIAGGDCLGKTIIFAKNHEHAVFIQERFDINYPNLRGHFARVIDFKTEYAQSLIDDFSNPDKMPHIAISVDMLDTGIDIPEIVNLVFFKLVRSKTKFWQMIGRGTRLRPDLFGPGQDKQFFYVFDYCQNLEFFSQNPEVTEGATAASLGKRLFTARLALIAELDKRPEHDAEKVLRADTASRLHEEVAAMNTDNFIVRPKRRLVEVYRNPDSWKKLGATQRQELSEQVAGLPSELPSEDEEAKRFDLLMLRLQLTVLRADPAFAKLRDQVISIADALEAQSSIPMIREQLELIQEIQTDQYWQDVTAPMLEIVRRRLRDLVKLIEKSKRNRIYTTFLDEIGPAAEIEIVAASAEIDFERFKTKVQRFLKAHSDHIVIHKLRRNQPLTKTDLEELEKILAHAAGVPSPHLETVKRQGLGLFIRSLIGLDREAAKSAFASFLSGKPLTASQIEFINLIIDHLTEHGTIEPERLYESPFTDFNPRGVEGLFSPPQVRELLDIVSAVHSNAA